ncbi:D-alanyl-D-alanine carboxypeptidase, partial [Methylopila musalis]
VRPGAAQTKSLRADAPKKKAAAKPAKAAAKDGRVKVELTPKSGAKPAAKPGTKTLGAGATAPQPLSGSIGRNAQPAGASAF